MNSFPYQIWQPHIHQCRTPPLTNDGHPRQDVSWPCDLCGAYYDPWIYISTFGEPLMTPNAIGDDLTVDEILFKVDGWSYRYEARLADEIRRLREERAGIQGRYIIQVDTLNQEFKKNRALQDALRLIYDLTVRQLAEPVSDTESLVRICGIIEHVLSEK